MDYLPHLYCECSSGVEPRFVVPVVAGSNPVIHPIFFMEQLFSRLSLKPLNGKLYTEALTHPSANKSKNYERLEFLGDAVIELVATQYIFQHFPTYPEGKMTKLRALTVSRPSLADFARQIGLEKVIVFSSGERKNKGKDKASNLSNAFEALLGAIYLDLGFEEAERVFLFCAKNLLDSGYEEKTGIDNPKGKLQETLQAIVPIAPTYTVISEQGPDHDKVFIVEVFWEGKMLSQGRGASKKAAESNAAMLALKAEGWNL